MVYIEFYNNYSFFDGFLFEIIFFKKRISVDVVWYDTEDGPGLIIYYLDKIFIF